MSISCFRISCRNPLLNTCTSNIMIEVQMVVVDRRCVLLASSREVDIADQSAGGSKAKYLPIT